MLRDSVTMLKKFKRHLCQLPLRRMFAVQFLMSICLVLILLHFVIGNTKLIWKKFTSVKDQPLSYIRFEPRSFDNVSNNPTYDNVNQFPCKRRTRQSEFEVEDLMCLERPDYLPTYKTPCFKSGESLKCLPYYLLLGFEKCGTTDFFRRLTRHPLILNNPGEASKETRYWSWLRYGLYFRQQAKNRNISRIALKKTLFQNYISMFDGFAKIIQRNNSAGYQPIVGDATAADVWQSIGWFEDPQNFNLTEPKVIIPHLMRHMFRDPKFIILMRDPVERLFSDYLFVEDGKSAEEFDRDVPIAIEMLNSCIKRNSTRRCFYSKTMHNTLPMRLYIGCYSVYLRDWFSVFQRHHFLIMRTEDYQNDMAGTVRKTYSFLEMDTLTEAAVDAISKAGKEHATRGKNSAGVMSKHTRQLLVDFYAPCNSDLAELLGDSRFLWEDVRNKEAKKTAGKNDEVSKTDRNLSIQNAENLGEGKEVLQNVMRVRTGNNSSEDSQKDKKMTKQSKEATKSP